MEFTDRASYGVAAIPSWRALWCSAGSEIEAADELDRRGVQSFCPRYQMAGPARRSSSGIRIVPFLRSYIFARFDAHDAASWHEVHDVRGIRRLISGTVSDAEIARLAEMVGANGAMSVEARLYSAGLSVLEKGDQCRLTAGLFAGHYGLVEDVDAKKFRVGVRIYFLSRFIVVNQPWSWCELEQKPPRIGHLRRRLRRPKRSTMEAEISRSAM